MTVLKMEDLQSDLPITPGGITRTRIWLNASYLAEVYTPDNLGVGRRTVPDGTRPAGARAQWEAWSCWERAEFLACCRRDSVIDAYADTGYDFSFVR